MPLTERENDYLERRIDKLIYKAIKKASLKVEEELRNPVKEEAKTRVIKRLGLGDYMAWYQQLEDQQADAMARLENLSETLVHPLKTYRNDYDVETKHELIALVIKTESEVLMDKILQESKLGQKVLHLQREVTVHQNHCRRGV